MTLHRCYDLFFIRGCRQVKQRIDREQLKEIMVRATKILGARAFIPVRTAVGNTLCAPFRNMACGNRRCCRGNIKNKPVNPGIGGGVTIFDNQNKAFRSRRDIAELQRRIYIFSVAGADRKGGTSSARNEFSGSPGKPGNSIKLSM